MIQRDVWPTPTRVATNVEADGEMRADQHGETVGSIEL